jgi:hypothetical protein
MTLKPMKEFNQKAESVLNDTFGHDHRSFQHKSDVEFGIDGRDHSIPGHPERPGAHAVQLLPEGELNDGEAGYFGHTVEVDGETFQVNWLW